MAIQRLLTLLVALALTAGTAMPARADEPERGTDPQECDAGESPDVIVGDLDQVIRHTRVGDITAYSVGTVSCNRGTCWLDWFRDTHEHPVIGQNMYRLKAGRFEQIGMSWLKHGFYAVSDTLCFPDCQDTDGTHLGVHCSDPYSASLNGMQNNLGPRSQVNAATGIFPYPWSAPPAPSGIGRRLQVHDADLNPATNAGAVYFVEGQYITHDDAAAGNDDNNASYRRVNVSGSIPVFNVTLTGTTQREQAAIRAWNDIEGGVTETDIDVPGDGRFILAAKATNIGGGYWHYEYALQNLNSDRSGASFRVPIDPAAMVQTNGFHDVDYHSGEPYSGTDWAAQVSGDGVMWSTTSHATDPNANALRSGTLYNYRLVTNVPPTPTTITLGLFLPGAPEWVTASTIGPRPAPPDCNLNSLVDDCDLDCGPPAGPCDEPGCGGSADCDSNGTPDECQADCDTNGVPDGCEADGDADGVADECDNCPADANADQGDEDSDGVGNACDPDFCRSTVLADDFESHQGWTVGDAGDNATTGLWTRVDPVGTAAQSEDDHTPDPAALCYVTGQGVAGGLPGDADVDGGRTTLLSPVFAICGDAIIGYWRWYSNSTGPAPNADVFTVDVSNNDGSSWVNVETIDPLAPETFGGWYYHEFTVSDFVTPSEQMKLRFVASDLGLASVIEAAVDDFQVQTLLCPADCNSNGVHDACDVAAGTSTDGNQNGVPDECEVPAATLTAALSRKSYTSPPVYRDIAVNIAGQVGTGGVTSEPRASGIAELRLTFDVPPRAAEPGSITIEQQGCGDPGYGSYLGFSTIDAVSVGNELVLSFTPGLDNALTYRFMISPPITSLTQALEVRGLTGDVDGNGRVNGLDRSGIIGIWTGIGYTILTDINRDGATNAVDRSAVVGAWTGPQNCAP